MQFFFFSLQLLPCNLKQDRIILPISPQHQRPQMSPSQEFTITCIHPDVPLLSAYKNANPATGASGVVSRTSLPQPQFGSTPSPLRCLSQPIASASIIFKRKRFLNRAVKISTCQAIITIGLLLAICVLINLQPQRIEAYECAFHLKLAS